MSKLDQLESLLSRVVYNRSYNALDGLHPIRVLLEKDTDGRVVQFLNARMPALPEKIRGGIAFALSEHYLKTGDLPSIRELFAIDDAEVQEAVLNGLWDEPASCSEMGPGIVALAVEGMCHREPEVRTEAASVIQNQSAWGVSVTDAIEPLLNLLDDPSPRVRQQAAYAVGNVAKRKYDLSPHLVPLIQNLHHADIYVRNSSAWSLWQLSRRRRDIAPAVVDLIHLLTSTDEYDEPRKNAAGALLHHARKSLENRDAVKRQIVSTPLDTSRKEIVRFLQQLADLG